MEKLTMKSLNEQITILSNSFDVLQQHVEKLDVKHDEDIKNDVDFAVHVKRFTKTAKLPEHAHKGDAGIDVFADYEYNKDGKITTSRYMIRPGQTKKISLGIGIELPDGYFADLRGRSGWQTNSPFKAVLGTIDNGYRGILKCAVYNVSQNPLNIVQIFPGDKIGQLVFHKMPAKIKIEDVDKFDNPETDRGSKGFGSTGKGAYNGDGNEK
jgi:dUTP pyrophosphatase